MCVLFTLVLLPALLSLLPLSLPKKKLDGSLKSPADWILKKSGDFAVSHPGLVIAVSLLIALVSGYGASQLRFSHDPIGWLPDSHPLRNANLAINDNMKGSAVLELVVQRHEENGVKEPGFMARLEAFNRFSENTHYKNIVVGKSTSIVDTVKEIILL